MRPKTRIGCLIAGTGLSTGEVAAAVGLRPWQLRHRLYGNTPFSPGERAKLRRLFPTAFKTERGAR